MQIIKNWYTTAFLNFFIAALAGLVMRLAFVVELPIDIGRILVIMQTEASALLGYTGALFRNFFGSHYGYLTSAGALLVWGALPFWIARAVFRRKDF